MADNKKKTQTVQESKAQALKGGSSIENRGAAKKVSGGGGSTNTTKK